MAENETQATASTAEPLGLKSKFSVDVIWNMASVFVIGVCGILMLAAIKNLMSYQALGVFNQVFTIYLFLSQLTVGGIHFSVLKHVSYLQQDRRQCTDIAVSALLAAFVLSVAVCCAAFPFHGMAGRLLNSPSVGIGIAVALPALVFQSANKVLVNILNGLRHMRAYAIFQTSRFVYYLAGVTVIAANGAPDYLLPAALTASEFLLTVSLVVYIHKKALPFRWPRNLARWLREHASFGARGVLSGTLIEMYARVDILMLGWFCSDHVVGIYSLPSMIVEGLGQLPFTVRKNVDPLLGASFAAHDLESIRVLSKKVKRTAYMGMAAIALVSVAGYPLGLLVLAGGKSLAASWACFAILIAGLLCASGYRCMGGVLLQGGRPGLHTFLTMAVVGFNFAMNAFLVPHLGLYGAALASSSAAIVDVALLVILARIFLRVRI